MNPSSLCSVTKGKWLAATEAPVKPWQGCSLRKSGLRGNALAGSGLGALFSSQLNLNTVPTASDLCFHFQP